MKMSAWREGGQVVFLANGTAGTGIVFALLMTGTAGLNLRSSASGSDLVKERPALVQTSDVKRQQQALQDRGYYQGKIDGVVGLRTRASIRGFQKAENLPVSGKIDLQTAAKLGVVSENVVKNRKQIGPQKNKPWAGTQSVKAVRPTRNTLLKGVPSAAHAESDQEYREDRLHAQNEKQPQ
jgi:peptidoglycan hydrolase-like protein with peptidoglycan-binding domain